MPRTPQPQASELQFARQRIYLKDVSFESPASPRVFDQPWQPQLRHVYVSLSGKTVRRILHTIALAPFPFPHFSLLNIGG